MIVLQSRLRKKKSFCTVAAVLLSVSFAILPFVGTDTAHAEDQSEFASIACIDGEAQQLYTSQNGLPATAATAIAQTSDGFVWIGGYGGITRFDGQSFEMQTNAPDFSVASLYAAADGTLWVGTSNRGLFHYVDGEYQQVACANCENPFNEVLCMAQSSDGSLILGTEHGLERVNNQEQVEEASIEGLPNVLIRSIACSNQDTMLLITQDGRLFLVANNIASELSLSGVTGSPRCVSFNMEMGNFYVGTDKSDVCILSPVGQQQSVFTVVGTNCINDVNASSQGVVWACSDNGIYSYYNGQTVKQNLQLNNSVDSMLIDNEGNHWFASSRQGVLLVSNSPFRDISSYVGMPNRVVNALVRYDGKFLVGTDSGMLVIDSASGSMVNDGSFDVLDGLRVRDLKVDSTGCLWAATTKGGIFRMSPDGNWTTYNSENSEAITTNNFRCLYEDGFSMIAGGNEGAVVINDEGVRNVVDDSSSLKVRVMSIVKMGDMLLFGTDSYGLQVVEQGKVVGAITTQNGLLSDSIMKIYPCSDSKTLLLVTSGGLVKIAPSSGQMPQHFSADAVTVSAIKGLPSSNTLDVIWQDNETVWVAAGNGLYRTTETSLLGDAGISYKLYTRQDGLPYDITANSTQLVCDDTMYISGTGGVAALDMQAASKMADACALVINGAYVDGQMIPVGAGSTITIPASAERIKIMAHAITFDKTNITLFYELGGYDSSENITQLNSLRGLEYTNLKGGTYQLRFGVWNEATNSPADTINVTIKKEYSLLEHPIVRSLEVMLVLVFIALGFRWWRRRVDNRFKAEYEEKERQTLKKMAYSDFLTNAYNRNYLNEWEKNAYETNVQFPTSLVILDLNNLKELNDTLGHTAGDKYLCRTTDILLKSFDKKGSSVVRMGGDEFLIIAEGMTEIQAQERIQSAREALSKGKIGDLQCGFCCGVAVVEGPEFSLDEELGKADVLMMEEKRRFHESFGAYDRRKADR